MANRRVVFYKYALALILIFTTMRTLFAPPVLAKRLVQPIENGQMLAIEGNVHPLAQVQYDQGKVESSFPLKDMTLVFKPAPSQQAELDTLLNQLHDPSSTNYHKWLMPEQFGNRFGLGQDDLNRVIGWLQSQGFTIDGVARSKSWITFSGRASHVEATFKTEIHRYLTAGVTNYANAANPSVPAALADVVLGFRGFNNFRPKPRGVFRRVRPNFTSSISGNHYLAPDDVASIYDAQKLYGGGIDGRGTKIAVMGQTDILMSDIETFRKTAGLPPNDPTIITIPGYVAGVHQGDLNEADLDLEWAGAVAKNASIIYVNAGVTLSAFDSLQYAVDQLVAPVISISYGDCEQNWGPRDLAALAQLGEQANAQGITIVAPGGDSGAADCDSGTSRAPATIAGEGFAVDAPASLPYVTGVGGSSFNDGSGNYWNNSNNASNGSAVSYIPEGTWNDTAYELQNGGGLSAGGGGASIFFRPKPAWQTGNGVPNDGARDVPDLALNASLDHEGYLACSQGSCVNGFRAGDDTLTVFGGTSAGAPIFAGIVALIIQKTGSAQGNVNYTLYSLAAHSPEAFHDITTGNNVVPCLRGSVDCPTSSPYQFGYSASSGYDLVTGLGSIDAFNLVTAWTQLSPTRQFIPFVTDTSQLRTNLGISNSSSQAATVILTLYDTAGNIAGSQTDTIPAYGLHQHNNVVRYLLGGDAATVTNTSGAVGLTSDQTVLAYATQIDNQSNDPGLVIGTRNGTSSLLVASTTSVGKFRSSLAIYNTGSDSASVTLRQRDTSGTVLSESSFLISPHGFFITDDLHNYLGLSNVFGPLEIISSNSASLVATSRVYSFSSGTSGFFDAVDTTTMSNSGILPITLDSASFRTNLGIDNLSDSTASVQISFVNGVGTSLGSKTVTVPAHGLFQDNVYLLFSDVPGMQAAASGTLGYLLLNSSQPVTGFTSLIDNLTDDPSIALCVTGGGTRVLVPSSTNVDPFRSNLMVINLSASSPAPITVTVRDSGGNIIGQDTTHVIPQNGFFSVDDLLTSLNIKANYGPLEVDSTNGAPVAVVSRIYSNNHTSGFFQGQDLP